MQNNEGNTYLHTTHNTSLQVKYGGFVKKCHHCGELFTGSANFARNRDADNMETTSHFYFCGLACLTSARNIKRTASMSYLPCKDQGLKMIKK